MNAMGGINVFDIMTMFFPIMFITIFAFILGTIVITIVSSLKEKRYNDSQPKLTTSAVVIEKRTEQMSHHENDYSHTSTNYYVTFEFNSGDRLELKVPRDEVGYIAPGDSGQLTFQGRRYFAFERD